MSLENFFKNPGRDMSEEQREQIDNVLNKYHIETYEEEREYLMQARKDLFEELKNSPTISKVINNPAEHIDDATIYSVEDIKKWIAELDKEIYKITVIIKKMEATIKNLQEINTDNPSLN